MPIREIQPTLTETEMVASSHVTRRLERHGPGLLWLFLDVLTDPDCSPFLVCYSHQGAFSLMAARWPPKWGRIPVGGGRAKDTALCLGEASPLYVVRDSAPRPSHVYLTAQNHGTGPPPAQRMLRDRVAFQSSLPSTGGSKTVQSQGCSVPETPLNASSLAPSFPALIST